MLMTQKQIITFELNVEQTALEMMVELMKEFGNINSILDKFKNSFEELMIIRTTNLVVFYMYTDDYYPLIRLFEGYGIAPRCYEMLVNTSESRRHLDNLVNVAFSKHCNEEQILNGIKEAYRASKKSNVLGPVLDNFIRGGINNHRIVRTETQLGKLAMSAVSSLINTVKKKSLEHDISSSASSLSKKLIDHKKSA